jgi:3-oxoacyl-[acyl-carrier protein] reductase
LSNTPTAIVTGGSRGIGKEVASLLSKMGASVVVCSRTQREIDSVVKEIRRMMMTDGNNHHGESDDDRLLGIRCDVSKSSEVDHLIKLTIAKFKFINILVNNAGIVFVKKLLDTSEEEWDKTIDTNLKGAFLCTKAVLPSMIQNRSGVIINVSSGAGKTGFPELSAYCASKFGMIGLTESLAWEVGNYGIRVMAISPGEVDTKMQEDVDPGYYRNNKHKMLKSKTVAEKILEMIFEERRYHNGQSIEIG